MAAYTGLRPMASPTLGQLSPSLSLLSSANLRTSSRLIMADSSGRRSYRRAKGHSHDSPPDVHDYTSDPNPGLIGTSTCRERHAAPAKEETIGQAACRIAR